MQYLPKQWSDFTNSWSRWILTLLWIQQYTMYPLHLNYATTLPRKTITMKITIFMVSAGVCYGGKGRLHFIPDKAKVNGKLYCEILLTRLVEDCKSLLPSSFVFQRDGAPAHTAKLAQNWIATNCSDFIGKDRWPPNSPDFNPLDYHVRGAMLERCKTLQPKPKYHRWAEKVLQTIWDDLPQNSINKAVLSFIKRLRACVKAGADTLNMSSNKLFSQSYELLASCDSLKCQISMFCLISIKAL